MTDKTTAPKRIYLDIGDPVTLDLVHTGRLPWERLREVTWSEDNASGSGVAYVREGTDEPLHPVRQFSMIFALGKRLAELLDEDQWAECETMLLAIENGPWRNLAHRSDSGAREGAGA